MEQCSFVDGKWTERGGKKSLNAVLQFFTKTFREHNSTWRIQFMNWRCHWLGLWKWTDNMVRGIRGAIGGWRGDVGKFNVWRTFSLWPDGWKEGGGMPGRSYILSRTINYLERHEFTFGTTTVSDRKRDPFSWP